MKYYLVSASIKPLMTSLGWESYYRTFQEAAQKSDVGGLGPQFLGPCVNDQNQTVYRWCLFEKSAAEIFALLVLGTDPSKISEHDWDVDVPNLTEEEVLIKYYEDVVIGNTMDPYKFGEGNDEQS